MTIESYKSVLTASETDIETDHGKAKVELIQMTKQLDQLDMERQKLLAENTVLKDEKKGLSLMLERSQHMQDNLSSQVEAMSQQVGIPKSEYDKLKEALTKREAEVVNLKIDLQKSKNEIAVSRQNIDAEMQKIATEMATTKSYLQQKEEEVVMLRRDVANANIVQVQLRD